MSGADALSSYESRRETFYRTEEAVKSRKKTQTIVWPHPISTSASNASSSSSLSTSNLSKGSHRRTSSFPSPSELALFGLYFTPGRSSTADDEAHDDDICTLYPEGDVVSGWKAGDEVAQRIRSVNPEAAFVLIADSRDAGKEEKGKEHHVWNWTEEHLLPTSKHMVEARLRTFAAFWPYDGKKGWKPTSKKVAAAGFYFNPNDEEQDCVTCSYCDCSLGGWEKGDDPVKEHQRRRPECAFFNCALVQAVAPKEVGTKSRAVSASVAATKQPRARAVSKRKAKEVDEADEEEEQFTETTNTRKDPEEASEGVETESADQKSKGTSRTKKQAIAVADDAVKMKASSSSSSSSTTKAKKSVAARKASTKVPAHEQVRDEPEAEEPASSTPLDEDVAKDDAKPAKSEQIEKAGKEPRTSSAAVERARTSTHQQSAVTEEAKEAGSHGSDERNKEPVSAKSFSIAPLSSLTNITSKEEQMTVEAWLRLQVEDACTEMQREGEVRIQRLEDEITQGRIKIEAILRGTQRPLGSTA